MDGPIKDRHGHAMAEAICLECKQPMLIRRHRLSDTKPHYCSQVCAGKAKYRQVISVRGHPPAWKGGPVDENERRRLLYLQHPERELTRNRIFRALQQGKLQKQPCAVCGLTNAEAHHPDYLQPLNVIWLCSRHHRRADIQARTR